MLVSAELRWFWKNRCPEQIEMWLQSKPLFVEEREDAYADLRSNSELGIKKRGSKAHVEIKGLVSTLPTDVSAPAPIELWCKWDAALSIDASVVTQKKRRLRKFAFESGAVSEVELSKDDGKPISGKLPDVGCNVELTKIRRLGDAVDWWSLGFEAFGGIVEAPDALRAVLKHLAPMPVPDGLVASYPKWLAS